MYFLYPIANKSKIVEIQHEMVLDLQEPLFLAPGLVTRQVGDEWLVLSPISGIWCYLTSKELEIAQALNGQTIRDFALASNLPESLLERFVLALISRQIFIPTGTNKTIQNNALMGGCRQTSRFTLTLLLSNHCNLACEYCYHAMPDQINKGNMSRETGFKALQYAFRQPCDELMIDFGEISINEKVFHQLLSDAKQLQEQTSKPTIFSIQTNGTTLTHKKAVFIKQNNIFVGLSLDGPEYLHDWMRKFPTGLGSYKNVRAGLDQLIDLGIPFIVSTTIHRNNYQHVQEILTHFKNLNIEHFAFKPIMQRGSAVSAWEKDGLFISEYYEFLDQVVAHSMEHRNLDWLDTIFIVLLQRSLGDIRGWGTPCYSGRCAGAKSQIVTNADGLCYPCPKFSSIGEGEFCLGTLESFTKESKKPLSISSTSRPHDLRLHPRCKDCNWWAFCGGGCPVVSDSSSTRNEMCLITSKMYELIFKIIFPQLRSGRFLRSSKLGELHFFYEDFFPN
jgi:uncharacterized protein